MKSIKKNRGMTYVELIVVLSIFAMISSVVMFNYGDFQSKVDMKNLASDMALKIVEAQRLSLSGVIPGGRRVDPDWKPSYGVYFNLQDKGGDTKFIYFSDLDGNYEYDGLPCDGKTECLNSIEMTKTNYISSIEAFYKGEEGSPINLPDVTITYLRPSSEAVIRTSDAKIDYSSISHVQVTINSAKKVPALIKIYTSGRIEIE